MGFFEKRRQKKIDKALEIVMNRYRPLSLSALEDAIGGINDLNVIESKALIQVYLTKLFTLPKSGGGFGISAEKSSPYIAALTEFSYRNNFGVISVEGIQGRVQFLPYRRIDDSGKAVLANLTIEFVRRYIGLGYSADILKAVLNSIFKYSDYLPGEYFIISNSPENFVNEDADIYDKWLYDSANEDEIKLRFGILIDVRDRKMLEKYGMYKSKNGAPTDEFITFDDVKQFGSSEQVFKFFDSIQTKRDGVMFSDMCKSMAYA